MLGGTTSTILRDSIRKMEKEMIDLQTMVGETREAVKEMKKMLWDINEKLKTKANKTLLQSLTEKEENGNQGQTESSLVK